MAHLHERKAIIPLFFLIRLSLGLMANLLTQGTVYGQGLRPVYI
jgi:hypothetical protein